LAAPPADFASGDAPGVPAVPLAPGAGLLSVAGGVPAGVSTLAVVTVAWPPRWGALSNAVVAVIAATEATAMAKMLNRIFLMNFSYSGAT
jgi:hypothetical protein